MAKERPMAPKELCKALALLYVRNNSNTLASPEALADKYVDAYARIRRRLIEAEYSDNM